MHRLTIPLLAVAALIVNALASSVLLARDDGQFADSPLKTWFDQLASGKGLCCSFADGVSIQDVDWDTEKTCELADGMIDRKNGIAFPVGKCVIHYRVRLNGQWVVVPDAAVVTEPNKFGPAVVWPYQDMNGVTQIRCFLPGAGA